MKGARVTFVTCFSPSQVPLNWYVQCFSVDLPWTSQRGLSNHLGRIDLGAPSDLLHAGGVEDPRAIVTKDRRPGVSRAHTANLGCACLSCGLAMTNVVVAIKSSAAGLVLSPTIYEYHSITLTCRSGAGASGLCAGTSLSPGSWLASYTGRSGENLSWPNICANANSRGYQAGERHIPIKVNSVSL